MILFLNIYICFDHVYCIFIDRFLAWAKSHSKLKVVTADIPKDILPSGYTGKLHDIRVFVKDGPDDALYDSNKEIRAKVMLM